MFPSQAAAPLSRHGGDGVHILPEVRIGDELPRAHGRAAAAGDALGIVNDGEVIDDVDGVELALLFAQVAADAAHVALAAGIGAALVVRAGDDDIGVVGHGDDDLARAHGGALQAAGALLGIDLRHAVHDVAGVKAAARDARAEAEAA